MKIKKIGNKIVNIGRISILPGETKEVDAVNTPALKMLEKHNFVEIIVEKPEKAEAPKAPKAPKAEEAKA